MSEDVNVNGVGVVSARLTLPRYGVWHAYIEALANNLLTVGGKATLTCGLVSWVGTVKHVGLYGGQTHTMIVGGADGMGKQVPAKSYYRVPAKIPVTDVLGAVGETLASSSDAGMLGVQLPFWTRRASGAGMAFSLLTAQLGATWRILSDGTVWLGNEAWLPAKVVGYHLLSDEPDIGRFTFTTDTPNVIPGTVLDGRRVGRVVYGFTPGQISAEAWTDA